MARPTRIHYAKPSIGTLEATYAADAVANGWAEHCYDYIAKFETAFKGHLKSDFAIATSSCTGAMHLGLAALGVGPGDEVIIADINWIACVAPILYLQAKPIFVDILPDTWCIDPEKAEAAITPRTKAIVAVHLYGNLCDMDRLQALSAKHRIPIIEDAAEAIGSVWAGRRAGSIGALGVFSFHGAKTVTTGEGGMLVTNDPALHARVITLNNHGRSSMQPIQFWPDELGYKYKMSNVQAAIGLAQMERIEELIAGKRRIFEYYQRAMQDLPIQMNREPVGTQNGYWMPTIVVNENVPFDRERLLTEFKNENIDGRVFFWPLSMLPMFEPQYQNRVSYQLHARAVNLPSYHDLSEPEMDRVVSIVRRQIEQQSFAAKP